MHSGLPCSPAGLHRLPGLTHLRLDCALGGVRQPVIIEQGTQAGPQGQGGPRLLRKLHRVRHLRVMKAGWVSPSCDW